MKTAAIGGLVLSTAGIYTAMLVMAEPANTIALHALVIAYMANAVAGGVLLDHAMNKHERPSAYNTNSVRTDTTHRSLHNRTRVSHSTEHQAAAWSPGI